MCSLLRYAAGGAAILLGAAYTVAIGSELSYFQLLARQTEPGGAVVDRAHKANKLSALQLSEEQQTIIATVEVIGLRDAAVVYRARDGRVLFRTDPVANATVVAKGMALPQVTIRDAGRPALQMVPAMVETVPAAPVTPPVVGQDQPKVLEGCDLAFSPLTASVRANFTGRCLAAFEPPTRIAAALP